MPPDFLAYTNLQDLITFTIISMVIVGLSPYGVFAIRYALAALVGAPRPRWVFGPRQTTEEHIEDVTRTALENMDVLSSRIEELEAELDAASSLAWRLEFENEALRTHIREMEQAGTADDDNNDERRPVSGAEANDDLELFGLDPGANCSDVQAAYRAAVRIHHPDKGGNPELLKVLNAAHERLKAKMKRHGEN